MFVLFYMDHMTKYLREYPVLFLIPLANMAAIANVPREIHLKHEFKAFLSSCAAMLLLMTLFGIGMYPNLIYSNPDSLNSLTIFNAASSVKTLKIMLIIALIGMPLVLSYTISIYWIFRGKVRLNNHSY